MRTIDRKYLLIGLLLPAVLVAGGWAWLRWTGERVEMAGRVPASAIGYLEIDSGEALLESLRRTAAWGELAPLYGVGQEVALAGGLAGISGLGEAQLALAVTGIEIAGEEVRPRMALLIETRRTSEILHRELAERLGALAPRLLGPVSRREEAYAGVMVTVWRRVADDETAERGLYAARVGGQWILANHPEPLRGCLDALLGRAPSLAGDFYWQRARQVFEAGGQSDFYFGFLTGQGVTRLLRSGSYLLSGTEVTRALLAGAIGEVVTGFAGSVCEGVAFSGRIEHGLVVDTTLVLLKPDLVERLQPSFRPGSSPEAAVSGSTATATRRPAAVELLPPWTPEWTLWRVESPERTLREVEAAISARVGTGESFLLHQFLLGARQAFLGLDADAPIDKAFGGEILVAVPEDQPGERLWLIAVRDAQATGGIVDHYLTAGGAVLRRESYQGVELLSSSDPARGAAVTIDGHLVLAAPGILRRWVDSRGSRAGGSLPKLTALPSEPRQVVSLFQTRDEAAAMMATLARLAGRGLPPSGSVETRLSGLPPAVRSVELDSRGVRLESRSPLGRFPLIVESLSGVSGEGAQ